MHTLDLSQPLTLLYLIQTNRTILLRHRRSRKPTNPTFVRLLVLLVKQILVRHTQQHIQSIVQHRKMNRTPKQGIRSQLRMLLPT